MKKLYNIHYSRHNARYKFVDSENDVTLTFTIKHGTGAIVDVLKVSKGRMYRGEKYYKAHEKDIHATIQEGGVHK